MDVYKYISDEVREYWNLTEQYMNEVIHSAPEVTTEMAEAHQGALHNLRMIISQINFEIGQYEEEIEHIQ